MLLLIAGKQASFCNALKTLLQTRPGLEIMGTVVNKEELFAQLNDASPDLLLLDEDLSANLVEDVFIPLGQFDPCPAVILLGGRAGSRKAYLDAGAEAFVNKSSPPKNLLTAIEGVRLRGKYV